MIREIKKDELNDLLELYEHMNGQDDPLPEREKIESI